MTKTQIAWIAGLLEGEGSFVLKSRVMGTARNISVQCHMTDRDVLDRLRRIVGKGRVMGPYRSPGPTGSKKIYKLRYMFQINGRAAYVLMKKILPRMLSRRATRIRELIAGYDSVKTPVYRFKHLATGRVESTADLRRWLRVHRVSETGIWRTLAGQRRQCKGWQRLQ